MPPVRVTSEIGPLEAVLVHTPGKELEAARERLEALNAGARDLFTRLEPVVASFCPGLAAQPYHLRQYVCDAPN